MRQVSTPETVGERAFGFGRFQLLRGQKMLLDCGNPVRLGSRALEILIALTERAGEVVTKAELIALVWPSTYVDEANLRVHIAALRKVLGDGADGSRFIVNSAGRGYCFVAPIDRPETLPAAAAALADGGVSLPASPSRILGRDEAIGALTAQVLRRRFVNIVGPGGIGKSTVAVAIAEQAARERNCSAYFVDLSRVDNAAMLPTGLGTALGVSILTDDPIQKLSSFLRDKGMLILLDNCEHLIEVLSPFVEAILSASSNIAILTTSREPFRISEEWVYRLLALGVPSTPIGLTAAVALSYPAIELFVERARSSTDNFVLDDVNAPAVADICCRLDGIPLAIELVAARMDLFSVQAIAKGLDNVLLTTKGLRKAEPRHQSLNGALDWSFSLLDETERAVLTRLSMFRGAFEMDSAASIASDETITPEDVKRSIFSLTAKSLVTTDASGPNIRYRLLLLTRVYATEKLHDTGEWLRLVRRHAEHFRDFMDAAQARWMDLARAEWLLEYSYAIDDIRTAMDWAFSPNGDVEMGASLAVGSLPFGNQMSLTDEFKRRVQLALDELSRRGPAHTIDEVRLTAALCNLNLNAIVSMSSMRGTFARVAELSKNILLPRDKIEPLLQQAFFLIEIGDYDASLRITQELGDSARAAEDPLAVLLADRVSAQTHHWAGDHIRARELAERVLRHPAKKIPLVYSRSSVDRRVSMRALLARLSWLEGRTDLAIQLIDEAMELAEKDGPFATCQTLALCACPIALWTGDITKAAVLIKQLLDLSERYALERWQRLGECFDAVLVRRTTEAGAMQPHYFAPQPAGVMQLELLITTDASLVDDDIAQRAKGGLSGWGNPEMLRAVGERYLREAKPRLGDAELTFIAALDNARHQKALAWEFRAAVSLGELWFGQNRFSDACTLLDPLMERFADQPETSDFRAAKDLLSRCTTC